MDKKKILLVAVAVIVVILGSLYSSSTKKNKYKNFVKEQTEAELTVISQVMDQLEENRWISVEKGDDTYGIKAEREEKIDLPETEYLTKEVLRDGDMETIIYLDGDGVERRRVGIEYYDAPKLAILIDDVGMNLGAVDSFGEIEEALTFATIPFLPKSREGTEKLKGYGFEVMLHMPMAGSSDSLNGRTKGILLPTMSKTEIYDTFDRALEDVGEVDGFNNHMGSRFTSDGVKMKELLTYAKKKELYFVDSNTAIKNMGYPISKEIGVPTYYCSHFLDNSRDMNDMKKEIETAVKMSKSKGEVLVIGHYHKGLAVAIKEMLPYIADSGVKLVFASELLESN